MGKVTSGQRRFAMIPSVEIPRSRFDRSCNVKTTLDAGYLVPIFVDEALPGDSFNLRMDLFGRLATPLHPVLDNMTLDSFFFAVPLRMLWENFQKFMGEQDDPGDSIEFEIPQMESPVGGYTIGSLSDYFGLPTGVEGLRHSALWHRAYNLIWKEWFRSEDLQDSPVIDRGDADSDPADFPLRRRGKRHDYFTSCLPFPQKGDSPPLPLGTMAPLSFPSVGNTAVTPSGGGAPLFRDAASTWTGLTLDQSWAANSSNPVNVAVPPGTSPGAGPHYWDDAALQVTSTNLSANFGGSFADLSAATAATINQLREAFQVQRWLERDARGGTRYTEIIRSHFGVVSPDARLQRPEYLGGGSSRILVHPVAQTTVQTAFDQYVGSLGGYGVVTATGHGFFKSFSEHCVILGFVSIRADLNYQQGLNRMFSRRFREDFYWPAFAHLGEQEVLNKEIYADGSAADEEVFGYQERYAEMRYKPSMITGQMRSTAATSLDTWHLAQEFLSLPVLGDTFIQEDPPVDRVIAVPSEPHLLLDGFARYVCARPMPTYSVPGLIDHF